MTVRTKAKSDRTSPEYLALLGAFPPRPIRNDREHQRSVEVVNGLLDRPRSPRTRRITSTFSACSSPNTRTRSTNIPNSRPWNGSVTSWMSMP